MVSDSSDNDNVSTSASVETTTTNVEKSGHSASSGSEGFVRASSRLVFGSKVLALTVIFIAAVICGFATFRVVRDREQEQFQTQFIAFATAIEDIVHQESRSTFNAIANLGASITSFVSATNHSFPFVTVPYFAIQGKLSNSLSQALQVTIAPLIKDVDRLAWEKYAIENQEWIAEGLAHAHDELVDQITWTNDTLTSDAPAQATPISPHINEFNTSEELKSHVDFGVADYAPVWQQAPAPHNTSIVNLNLLSHPTFARLYHGVWETHEPLLSEVLDLEFLYGSAVHDDIMHPHSFLLYPIYPSFGIHKNDDLAAVLVAVIGWDKYFESIIHEDDSGIIVVVNGTCGDIFTYKISGATAHFQGVGDLHDSNYDRLMMRAEFAPDFRHNFSEVHNHCKHELLIYPSKDLENKYTSRDPITYAIVVVLIFACTAVVFLIFDHTVQLRQKLVMSSAKRAHKIVSSLFPSNVRDRILIDAEQEAEEDLIEGQTGRRIGLKSTKAQLKDFLGETKSGTTKEFESKPIADLFPSATIMFADIAGFTAWSSQREPCQVFTLLEVVYQAFDKIAKQRRVFKVETIGDSYVAVCGLPDPRADHAVVMARFARDCLAAMNRHTKELETMLGPDTSDLAMRIGLHSGPVVAGVLRGDKGRFQLFGDTVNTAARMESNGAPNCIQCSQETADLLEQAGKTWTRPRKNTIKAKGKGELQTYWLDFKGSSDKTGSRSSYDDSSCASSYDTDVDDAWVKAGLRTGEEEAARQAKEKVERLVDWNTDVLCRILKQIVACNQTPKQLSKRKSDALARKSSISHSSNTTVIDEVVEVIELPELNPSTVRQLETFENIVLDPVVEEQVRHYINTIACTYRDNKFHNFDHASHVAMSVTKLLSRIVATTDILVEKNKDICNRELVSSLHDHTYGITSDPLTHFASVLAALIHDVDHPGVPNTQLVKEESHLAVKYHGKSIAEQNSIDIAWALFMKPEYVKFRQTLCPDPADMKRFRQIVVNLVMATDVMDPDLKTLRNNRWTKAFAAGDDDSISNLKEQVNRKATIVLEHLVQASDISHTMQHWQIYRKWNECLFLEMYTAYKDGRSDTDPTDGWYQGEIGFFDYYVIPLAKKLKECGVFGVSSDEYLNYAQKNRDEWVMRGKEVVASLKEKVTMENQPGPFIKQRDQEETVGAYPNRFTAIELDDEEVEEVSIKGDCTEMDESEDQTEHPDQELLQNINVLDVAKMQTSTASSMLGPGKHGRYFL